MNSLNFNPTTRFLDMYTPQQIAGFERALEKARMEHDRYQNKVAALGETIKGFENLLREVKKDAK